MPIMSIGPSGEITTTRSASAASPKDAGDSMPPLPRVCAAMSGDTGTPYT